MNWGLLLALTLVPGTSEVPSTPKAHKNMSLRSPGRLGRGAVLDNAMRAAVIVEDQKRADLAVSGNLSAQTDPLVITLSLKGR